MVSQTDAEGIVDGADHGVGAYEGHTKLGLQGLNHRAARYVAIGFGRVSLGDGDRDLAVVLEKEGHEIKIEVGTDGDVGEFFHARTIAKRSLVVNKFFSNYGFISARRR